MKSGIYTITNKTDGKIYVGYSIDLKERKGNHFCKLRTNKHYNIHLQNAVNKYGIDNFEFEVLEYWEEEFLCSMENWWCNMLNTHNPIYGYNDKPTNPYGIGKMTDKAKKKIGEFNKGKVNSEETRRKMSIYRLGKKVSQEEADRLRLLNQQKQIPVLLYNSLGIFQREFKSVNEASRITGIHETTIRRNIKEDRYSKKHKVTFKRKINNNYSLKIKENDRK